MAESKATEHLRKTNIETLQFIEDPFAITHFLALIVLFETSNRHANLEEKLPKMAIVGESKNVSFDDEESSEAIELEPYPMSQVHALEFAKPSGNNNITLGILRIL
ncbi:uncharacterized protein Bfra_006848ib [Botrytis fragariae]|uniref:Uncharacterized protein n=1 Tax=Botrytis fragariae TaxID=1964551 RepID=A0A8H6B605_9HELO|nr:uncharacterized protein Bfra_006848ib [Botrytis fragariae]KAF5879642.1 hypothetical protein Bfra_006848ib [Botrytis fragariae]